MRPDRPRKFTILDAIVVIAALASGAALARPVFGLVGGHWSLTDPATRRYRIEFYFALISPGVATLTVATLILRLRKPRPTFRCLVRQPGMVATIASLVGLAGAIMSWGYMLYHTGLLNPAWLNINFWARASIPTACTVIGSWLILALGGRWRAERSWIDRIGRVLGLYWIAVLLIVRALDLL